ncbi:hypothetical protein MMC25_002572 [Agyrium rufum]|nr:hypothetical protein [Agyrium rufum]
MDPLKADPEKGVELTQAQGYEERINRVPSRTDEKGFGYRVVHPLQRIEDALSAFSLESRGIQRVSFEERHPLTSWSYLQTFVLWVSINLAAVNITLGMLAPTTFALSFRDAALCAVFGSLIGSVPVAYIATWGPISGNRAMVVSRYVFGWWPNKLVVVLNIIVLLGYALINCVVAGQILSAVSPDRSMSVVVGIVIVAVITWGVTTFGIRVFHYYERYAFIPQLVVVSILYGVSSKNYDLSTPSEGNPRTIIGNRISFFSLCLSAAITYAGVAADYFVYYPPTSPRVPIFILSLLGLAVSFTFALLVGIGLATGIPNVTSYSDAYEVSQGALLVEGFSSLGDFGKFCGVVTALGVIANLIPPTYSSGLDFQLLAHSARQIPRFVWNTIGVIIYAVCALAGRNNLSEIFTNFLALMGYWVAIWIAIVVEEHVIFRNIMRRGWDWEAWDQRDKLPVGIAALIAFLIGWAGAILCMAQFWYIGPIARLVGDYGADLGNYVGFSWAALVYPPLRWLELRKFKR